MSKYLVMACLVLGLASSSAFGQLTNVALNRPVYVDSEPRAPKYVGQYAVDGINDTTNLDSRWFSDESPTHWIYVELDQAYSIEAIRFFTGGKRYNTQIEEYTIQSWDGSDWVDIVSRIDNRSGAVTDLFNPVVTDRIRLYITKMKKEGKSLRMHEFEVMARIPVGDPDAAWMVDGSKVYVQDAQVGINTDTPSAALDVNGTVNVTDTVRSAFADLSNGLRIGEGNINNLGAGIAQYNGVEFQVQGNFGVIGESTLGTTSVEGLLAAEELTLSMGTLTINNPEEYTGSNSNRVLLLDDNNQLKYVDPTTFGAWSKTSQYTYISDSVGIGTTSPDAQLTVAGRIHGQEMQVSVTAGEVPDYVFEKEYVLRSIDELKQYIQENKHLPEIPSAQEYGERGGLDLGELNLKLLQKVEELTLYLIDQNERIEKLEKQLDSDQ